MGFTDLHEHLEKRAAPYYRATAKYDGDSTDVLYLRDDIRERRLQSEIDRMMNRLRSESTSKEKKSFPLGDLYATVRSFEKAIIMHFPTGHDRGIVVALDPEAAEDLNTFIGDCHTLLEK